MAWVPAHLTDPQKADATEYTQGDMVQFHQNAKGFKKGARLVVREGQLPPTAPVSYTHLVTAGEPLKLLEERAGLPLAEVTEILRQQRDYKKVARALSEGRTDEAFVKLDKLGWIREVDDRTRYQQLAAAYLSAVAEKKKGGEQMCIRDRA